MDGTSAPDKGSARDLAVATPSQLPAVPAALHCPPRLVEPHGDSVADLGRAIDRNFRGAIAPLTGGISPGGLSNAFGDWAAHLAMSPGHFAYMWVKAFRKAARFGTYATEVLMQPGAKRHCIEPLVQDRRFAAPQWQDPPFNLIQQAFLLGQQWWHNAATGVSGVSKHHEQVVDFLIRQGWDMFSPSNSPMLNPEVMERASSTGGVNFLIGYLNFLDDMMRSAQQKPPHGADAYVPGRAVAVTPGKVVFRNPLIELIQYAPRTEMVRPEPILIVPAWIMKYYILDLSPENSLVRYLTEAGYTVFMVSWRNPDAYDAQLGMEDYRRMGVMAALGAVSRITGGTKVHLAGYCLGGTLAAITAAAMARDGDDRLQSLTLFAAQTDFTEPGELSLFIGPAQVRFLEDVMWRDGYLDSHRMSGAFQLLRSNDLVWSRMVRNYLMGEREEMSDLMAWNADGTRLPARMHGEYLERMYLNNELARAQYPVEGRPVALTDIRAPVLAVGTERDHVAPWHSVYKIGLLTDTEVTFLVASGGHSAGIVSPRGPDGRHSRIAPRRHDAPHLDAERYMKETPIEEGSWWPGFVRWLDARSGAPVAPPAMGTALGDAPGTYVLEP